jgi:hypothetical protein
MSADPRNSLRILSVFQDRRAASCRAAGRPRRAAYVNFARRCDYLANSAALSRARPPLSSAAIEMLPSWHAYSNIW